MERIIPLSLELFFEILGKTHAIIKLLIIYIYNTYKQISLYTYNLHCTRNTVIPTYWIYDAICPVRNSYKLKIQFKKPYTRFEVKVIQFWLSTQSFYDAFLVS